MQALFWRGTLDNKSGFRCHHLGCLTGRGLNAYSLGKYFLAPSLHSYQIQDGGLIRKCTLARPKYACTAGYLFSFCVTRPKLPPNVKSRNLSCLFAKSCRSINTRKMLRILFSLMYVKCIFFSFYRKIGFGENIKYTKKIITPGMEFADIAAFTLAT